MTDAEKELAELERLRKIRAGKRGMAKNIEAIDARIAELRNIIAGGEG